ncbi:uncharacterized protein LOC117101643 [Anneissia japonica]|uniref:uncharacterized protein LOC117101643 n=1 Tax=Anneissia japonica TaxID=1529436 RepID=UPI0014258384|nr:uncharacterized protein LOC117101643 [Anneissia japonica]
MAPWNSYRTCTAVTSVILLISGLFLIAFWSSCYQHCLTKNEATNDAASPLWTGIIVSLVGIFGMFASFLYWQPKNDIAFVFMNMILILCSIVCVALSIYASYKEWKAYDAATETSVENYTVLGVVLFALMAFFAFLVLIVSVLWTCCFCSWRDTWDEGPRMADPNPHTTVKVIEIPRYSVYGSSKDWRGYSSDVGRRPPSSLFDKRRSPNPWWRSYRRRPYDPYYWPERRSRRHRPRNWWMAYPPYDSSVSSAARLNTR